MKALKEEKPATWKTEEASLRKRLGAERKERRSQIEKARYRYLKKKIELPEYDMTKTAFVFQIPGVWSIGGSDEDAWSLAFDTRPRVKRRGRPHEDRWGKTLLTYDYFFEGGKPRKWSIPVSREKADGFVKEQKGILGGPKLSAEIVFQVKGSTYHGGKPRHGGPSLRGGAVGPILAKLKTGAGQALVVKLVAWRLLAKKGAVVAASPSATK